MRRPFLALLLVLFFLTSESALLAQQGQPPAGVPEIPQSQMELLPDSAKVSYPIGAQRDGIQGQVVLGLTISPEGKVEKIDRIDGPDQLVAPTEKTVKKWKFKPYAIAAGKPTRVYSKFTFNFFFKDKVVDRKDPDATAIPLSTPGGSAPPAEGTASGPLTPGPVRVSQGVSQGLLLHSVAPVYPPEARRNGVQGQVVLRAVIDKEGKVRDLELVSGRHELAEAAMAAVKQWRYRPYKLKGEPVEVQTQITVNFQLSYR